MKKRTPKQRPTRRTAEEARALILDAAEKQLEEGGPSSIRLQAIADAVGVSHPTVLHHFGTRELLVEAVVQRALDGLQRDVFEAWQKEQFEPPDAALLLARVRATLGDRGHARLIAWLALEGRPQTDEARMLRVLAHAMHARREREAGPAPLEDTTFLVMLVALVMLADAVLGDAVRDSAGVDRDAAAQQRFHTWLVNLVHDHMHRAPAPRARPPARNAKKQARGGAV
ncbi:MAG: TetR/AcrR family transcriptional regulator [Polyangiaceae bacterium]